MDVYDEEGITAEAMDDAVNKLGVFILISSESVLPRELLPLYYTRQTVKSLISVKTTLT